MRCYEIDRDGFIVDGLLIDEPGRGRVQVRGPLAERGDELPVAIMSDALKKELQESANDTFKAMTMRLLRCDLDVRNLVYLTPETGESRQDVLLLMHLIGKDCKIAVKSSMGPSPVVLDNRFQQIWKEDSPLRLEGRAVLIHMKKSDMLTISANWLELEQPEGWRKHMAMPKFKAMQRTLIVYPAMTPDGKGATVRSHVSFW